MAGADRCVAGGRHPYAFLLQTAWPVEGCHGPDSTANTAPPPAISLHCARPRTRADCRQHPGRSRLELRRHEPTSCPPLFPLTSWKMPVPSHPSPSVPLNSFSATLTPLSAGNSSGCGSGSGPLHRAKCTDRRMLSNPQQACLACSFKAAWARQAMRTPVDSQSCMHEGSARKLARQVLGSQRRICLRSLPELVVVE